MNRTALKTLSSTLIADAPPENITAQDMRDLNDQIVPSNATILEQNTFSGATIFDGVVTINDRLDTAYQPSLSINGTTDLGNINGNFVWLSGTPDTINSFGTAQAGAIRHLLFYDPCIISNNSNIECITNQPIFVQSGDTCTMISKGSGVWKMVSYLRKSGIPTSAGNQTLWTVNTAPPSVNEGAPAYQKGSRWISKESGVRWKEWILDNNDTFGAAVWNPLSGKISEWGMGGDLEIDVLSFQVSGDNAQTNCRYIRISNHVIISGEATAENWNGKSCAVQFLFSNNTQGLNFNQNIVGFGVVYIDGVMALSDNVSAVTDNGFYLNVLVKNGYNFGSSIKVVFTLRATLI